MAAQKRTHADVRLATRDTKPAQVISSPTLRFPVDENALFPAGFLPRAGAARSGDLIGIHGLLKTVFRGPSAAEFQAQQETPGSDPAQRFVARDRHEIIAHVRVSPVGQMQYGDVAIPSAWLMDLATATGHRGQGLATELIVAAEGDSLRRGATRRGSSCNSARTPTCRVQPAPTCKWVLDLFDPARHSRQPLG